MYNYYDTGASIKLHFNHVSSRPTRGKKFKLRKDMCRYDTRKYSFCYRIVNIWNSFSDLAYVVEALQVVEYFLISYRHMSFRNLNFLPQVLLTGLKFYFIAAPVS